MHVLTWLSLSLLFIDKQIKKNITTYILKKKKALSINDIVAMKSILSKCIFS